MIIVLHCGTQRLPLRLTVQPSTARSLSVRPLKPAAGWPVHSDEDDLRRAPGDSPDVSAASALG
eukprot:564125-Hanusia_phi.AAC.1